MSELWKIVAWFLSLVLPAADMESARCAACAAVAYAAQASGKNSPSPEPSPVPPAPNPSGCPKDCSCGGTGWVKTPEGFRIPCPCPQECECKKAQRGEK